MVAGKCRPRRRAFQSAADAPHGDAGVISWRQCLCSRAGHSLLVTSPLRAIISRMSPVLGCLLPLTDAGNRSQIRTCHARFGVRCRLSCSSSAVQPRPDGCHRDGLDAPESHGVRISRPGCDGEPRPVSVAVGRARGPLVMPVLFGYLIDVTGAYVASPAGVAVVAGIAIVFGTRVLPRVP